MGLGTFKHCYVAKGLNEADQRRPPMTPPFQLSGFSHARHDLGEKISSEIESHDSISDHTLPLGGLPTYETRRYESGSEVGTERRDPSKSSVPAIHGISILNLFWSPKTRPMLVHAECLWSVTDTRLLSKV